MIHDTSDQEQQFFHPLDGKSAMEQGECVFKKCCKKYKKKGRHCKKCPKI
ncbi:hypothetical protein [Marinoscillum furvescens]|nr:hypothetical protein [Marinoscillum furvescens]